MRTITFFSISMFIEAPSFLGICDQLSQKFLPGSWLWCVLDILPMSSRGQGIPHFTMGVSCFNGVCLQSSRIHRSYHTSTGRSRESRGQNVLCCIDIPIVPCSTSRADPFPHIQRECIKHMPTIGAGLGGG